jgi:Domain of unknown function (DUF4062)
MKNVNILSVFIGSTSDLAVERKEVAKAIIKAGNRLNREAIHLAPVMWETDAISEGRQYPQESINIRQLDQCDVFVFIFHIRVGSKTPSYVSATIEEYERAFQKFEAFDGPKPICVFFSRAKIDPFSPEVNLDDIKCLRDFKLKIANDGIVFREFTEVTELCDFVEDSVSTHAREIVERLAGSQFQQAKLSELQPSLQKTPELVDLVEAKPFEEDDLGYLELVERVTSSFETITAAFELISEQISKLGRELIKGIPKSALM